MTKFLITEVDSDKYKDDIKKLWSEHLKDTPSERYEWLKNNPDGGITWLFAFEKETRKIAGAISILPKKMILKGRLKKAGIVGDFMIANEYRVFGPALSLLKETRKYVDTGDFDFLYTIPNLASKKLVQRSGFSNKVLLKHYVRPIVIDDYIKGISRNQLINWMLGHTFEMIFKIMSIGEYFPSRCCYEITKNISSEIDSHFNCLNNNRAELVTYRSHDQYKWKYLSNPTNEFFFLLYKNKLDEEIRAFIVFSIKNNKIEIFDMAATKNIYFYPVIKELVKYSKKNSIKAIYIRLSESHKIRTILNKFLFFDCSDDIELFTYGDNVDSSIQWSYFENDRNL